MQGWFSEDWIGGNYRTKYAFPFLLSKFCGVYYARFHEKFIIGGRLVVGCGLAVVSGTRWYLRYFSVPEVLEGTGIVRGSRASPRIESLTAHREPHPAPRASPRKSCRGVGRKVKSQKAKPKRCHSFGICSIYF